jgi:hypothetical protein
MMASQQGMMTMTNAIWIDEKTGTVRVAADRKTAEHQFGNGGRVFETSDELATDGTIQSKVLVEIYNRYVAEDKAITKFADRKTAADRTFKAIMTHEPVTASKEDNNSADGATAQPAAPSVPATTAVGKKPRGAKGNRAKKIFPIDGKDPFKSGASAATWKMIKEHPGKTFAEYVAMGGRANTIAGAIRGQWVRLED